MCDIDELLTSWNAKAIIACGELTVARATYTSAL